MPFIALVLVLSLEAQTPEGVIATALTGDVDGDGQADTLTFYGDAAGTHGVVAGPVTSPVYAAWKADAGRLSGDGRDSVVLGVWTNKRTRPGEPMRKTIWVVGLEHGRWVERWRGSMLQRPFEDFALVDIDRDGFDELVVRECNDRFQGFAAYRWQGFGFEGVARLAAPCIGEFDELRAQPDAVRPSANWNELRLDGGKLWRDDG